MLGFLSGWVSFFVGFSAPIAASAIGFTEYLTRAFPKLMKLGIIDSSLEATVLKKFYAVLVIAIFTVIHMRGIELGARVQNYLTILKVALIVGLIFIGFMVGKGSMEHFNQGITYTFNFGGWKTIGLSLMWIMFAYSGWNAAAYVGSEIKRPKKNLPRSLILGTGLVILLYFGLNLFYVYAVTPQNMEGVISIGGAAVGELFGQSFESWISVLISFALFSSLSAFIILGPRIYYAMARDGFFFKFASEVHPKSRAPVKSIVLQGSIAIIMVFMGTFDQILTYMGFSLGIFPIFAVLGIFKLRRSKINRIKMPGFPWVPLFYILATLSILILAFFERPTESSIAIITALAGIPIYLAFKKFFQNKKQ
jgi:APA family basic amino acid/polyamine antiporter